MKLIVHLAVGFLLGQSVLHAQEPQTLDENMLAHLRAEAAHAHPSAAAARQRAAAAAQDVNAVRLWDDPRLGFGFMAANRQMRADLGDISVGLEQVLPKPGMFDAQFRKAQAMQLAAVETARGATLAASAEAAKTAIELALTDESITLQQSQITWLSAMTANARQLAAGPLGSSVDALRMETELAKQQQMLEAARRSREGLARQLNLTLSRPLDAVWPSLKLPATALPVPLAGSEIARIDRRNPQVRALTAMAGAAGAETRIADRDRLPEIAVGVDANLYSGGEARSATLGIKMSLPWFNEHSYQAKISAAHHRELAADREVAAMRREVAAAVLAATTTAANAAAQAQAYAGTIHDKARQTTTSIEAAWISSKAPLTDLLDSARLLFAIRLEQRRFIAMEQAALETLHTLVPNR